MKKMYIKYIAGAAAVLILAGVYFFLLPDSEQQLNTEENNTDVSYNDMTQLIKGNAENISSVTLNGENGIVEIIPAKNESDRPEIKGYENTILNSETVDTFTKSILNISGKVIDTQDKELSQYGLGENGKNIVLKFNDGSERILYIGEYTPDGEYCYAKTADNDKVYMIGYINGKRVNYTINDFIDKTFPLISPYTIQSINIKRKEKDEIDIVYERNKSGNAKELISMGMETMMMNKPYSGMAVYPNNLQDTVLINIQSIKLGDAVEFSLDNSEKFGLDKPTAEINISDTENSLKLIVGNMSDENNYYCVINDKNAVFTIDKQFVEPFINADPIKFVEKFVALYYRADVLKAEMSYKGKNYEITFGDEEKTDDNSENQNSRFNDDRKVYINGTEVDKSTFSEFFELLVGITFDKIDEKAMPLSDEAEAVIKYTLKDGSYDEVRFLPFNDSFYIVQGKSMKGMLVSRQKVGMPFDKADEILS